MVVIRCLLFVVWGCLFVVRCLLFHDCCCLVFVGVVCRLFRVVHRLLFVCCLWFVVRCLLVVVCRLLSV